MHHPEKHYFRLRLEAAAEALIRNNFQTFVVDDAQEAKEFVLSDLIPASGPKSLSWGGSGTFKELGLYEALAARKDIEVLDTYDKGVSGEEILERRRQALTTDMFFTGANAVTLEGQIVNLDRIGNRAAAMAFGPKEVVVLAGRNKLVTDLDEAWHRIKNHAAPLNAMRLDKKTPCVKTGFCEECKSSDRICNVWTVNEKSFPKGRIKVVLINQDLGI